MEPVDTIQISESVRVQLFPDDDCSNPLTDQDHGIQFVSLPRHYWEVSSRAHIEEYSNTYSGVTPIDPGNLWDYRENYDDSESHDERHRLPSLRRWLNNNTAAWLLLNESSHGEGFHVLNPDRYDDDEIRECDAIALVSRAMFREWHGIPADKPMPRGYRQRAAEALQSVLDEYNKWAQGECYGYVVQRHSPTCLDCMDPDDDTPQDDCPSWTDTDDSCWGFIGYEYAEEEATHAGMDEAGIPIPQVTRDQKGITLERMEGVLNTESPASRTVLGYDRTGHLTILTGGRYVKGTKYAYDKYPATHMRPEYHRDSDRVTVWFERDDQETNDKIIIHRLSWESAKRTAKNIGASR